MRFLMLSVFLASAAFAEPVDLSKLIPLPALHKKMMNVVTSRETSQESVQMLKAFFESDDGIIVPFTPETRARLKLNKDLRGVFFPGEGPGVIRMPLRPGQKPRPNDRIPADTSGFLNKSARNVLVQDIPKFGAPFKEREGFAIESLGHEVAHADFHIILARVAGELLKIIPQELLYKTSEGYFMDGELLDLLHEWYAHRSGYRLMVEYWASTSPDYARTRAYRVRFPSSDGPPRYFTFTYSMIDSISKRIAIEAYEIENPTVIALADAGILDKILELNTIALCGGHLDENVKLAQ